MVKRAGADSMCRVCRPDELPKPTERLSEGHVAVEFRDYGHGTRIELDGKDITNVTIEAFVADRFGVESYAVVMDADEDGNAQICQCNKAMAVRRVIGNITVSKVTRIPDDK